jgi:hypothetical protein
MQLSLVRINPRDPSTWKYSVTLTESNERRYAFVFKAKYLWIAVTRYFCCTSLTLSRLAFMCTTYWYKDSVRTSQRKQCVSVRNTGLLNATYESIQCLL